MDNEDLIGSSISSGHFDQALIRTCKPYKLSTLLNFCLKTVVDNLARFNDAFHSTVDERLERNIHYLLKHFSSRILQDSLEDGELNEAYFNILVNEFLEEIKLSTLVLIDDEIVLKKMAEIGSGIKKVHFDEPILNRKANFISRLVSYLPNVEKLLIHSHCHNDTIAAIASTCKKLRVLHINGISEVSDEGIQLLETLSGTLTNLSLKYTDIEESGISFLLQNMPSLQVLVYHELPNVLHRMHKSHLLDGTLNRQRKYELTTLDMCHKLLETVPNVDDTLAICSVVCPRLKRLTTLISKERQLEAVSLFHSLETLTVHGTRKDPPVDLEPFLKSSGHRLKGLKIDSFAFSPSVLVKSCPRLKFLRIGKNTFREQRTHRRNRQLLINLQHLTVDKLNFRDKAVEDCFSVVLDSSPGLSTLVMRNCEMEGSTVGQKLSLYFKNCNLRSVTFHCSDIKFALLQALLECVFLESLTINLCRDIRPSHIEWFYKELEIRRKYVLIKYNSDLISRSIDTCGSSEDF